MSADSTKLNRESGRSEEFCTGLKSIPRQLFSVGRCMSVLPFFFDIDFCHLASIGWCSWHVVTVLGFRPKREGSNPTIGSLSYAPYPRDLGMSVAIIGAKEGHLDIMMEKKGNESVHTGNRGMYRE